MTGLRINPQLDFAASAGQLKALGRIQLPAFLDPAAADALATDLGAIDQWDLALTDTQKGPYKLTQQALGRMTAAQRARIAEDLRRQARSGFSFAYYRRDVLPGDDRVLPEFAEWLEGGAFLDTLRRLTGVARLTRSDAHATCYRPGSFLRRHDDTYAGKSRRFAWVLNLTREWEADWGGLLHFQDGEEISGCFLPRFNSLSLFAVPQDHFVSQVATYARAPRLALTGWLFDD